MGQEYTNPQRSLKNQHRRHVPRSLVRRIVGWSVIGLAGLGFVLPVLPGLIFLGIGIMLLGPYDPTLRRIAVAVRLLLRRWSQTKQRQVRWIGCVARQRYRVTRLALRAHLHLNEHGTSNWRVHAVLMAATLIGVAVTASAMFVFWHTVL